MEHKDEKAEKEARYLALATEHVDSEFRKPGIHDWQFQPGTLQEWVAFRFRRSEMIARKIRAMRAWDAMPDKYGCGWVDNEDIERVMADHRVKWPLEDLVKEKAEDFVDRLQGEGRKIFKDFCHESGVDDDQSLEKALEKMTSFNVQK